MRILREKGDCDTLIPKLTYARERADLATKPEEAEADGKKAKLALDFSEGRITQEEYRRQLAQMPLRVDQCSAPLELAVAHGCKLAEALHPNRFSEHVLAELKTTQGALQARVSSLQVPWLVHPPFSSTEKKKRPGNARSRVFRRG